MRVDDEHDGGVGEGVGDPGGEEGFGVSIEVAPDEASCEDGEGA